MRFKPRFPKGGGYPSRIFPCRPRIIKGKDQRHLWNLKLHPLRSFWWKKSGVPPSGGAKVSRQRCWVREDGCHLRKAKVDKKYWLYVFETVILFFHKPKLDEIPILSTFIAKIFNFAPIFFRKSKISRPPCFITSFYAICWLIFIILVS